jgi:hypothetical protein
MHYPLDTKDTIYAPGFYVRHLSAKSKPDARPGAIKTVEKSRIFCFCQKKLHRRAAMLCPFA